MLSTNSIQNVRDLNILDVINKYNLKIEKAGNLYKACCPFHAESTPSFTIRPDKGTYKCFGCGAGGDGIQFVMQHDKLDFIPAVERIATDNNIFLEYEQQTEEQIKKEEEKKTLFDATDFAQKYFTQSFVKDSDPWNKAIKRGLDENEIRDWKIGFAPEGNFLSKYALETGNIELYYKASLLGANPNNTVHYDFYQNRIIVPVFDAKNRILTFAGRALGDELPKYKNGRENDIYSKSKILFGVHKYKSPFTNCNFTVLVEGYFDVIALHKVGLTNSLAKNGTALSKEQCKELKKKSEYVIIFYDNDKKNQGLISTLKEIDLLLEEGLKVKVYVSWVGKDADDFCQDWYKIHPNLSIANQIFKASMDAVEFKSQILLTKAKTPGDISDAKNAIGEMLSKISNETLRTEYVKYVSQTTKTKEKEYVRILKNIADKKAEEAKKNQTKVIPGSEEFPDWFDKETRTHWAKFRYAERIDNVDTGYYFPDNTFCPIRLTNFVLVPLYLVKADGNARRMVEIFAWDNYNNQMISEVMSLEPSEFIKKDNFETKLITSNPFITYDGYSNFNHKKIYSKLVFQFKECWELTALGFQQEKFWAFSNLCYELPTKEHADGVEKEYNEFGVVSIGKRLFLSEAQNKRNKEVRQSDKNPFANDMYFVYKKSPISFQTWANLINKVYGDDKSWLGTAFVIMTLFKDIIINYSKMPHLHCYGEKGSGKSDFAESLLYVFFSGIGANGLPYKGFNLGGGGTTFAFHNSLARYNNCAQLLNEFDDTSNMIEYLNTIKAVHDQEGREKGSGIKGKTEIMQRNCTLILCGQKIGSWDDNSITTRSICEKFLKVLTDRPDQQVNDHRLLKDYEAQGLSSLIIEILSHRMHFEQRIKELFIPEYAKFQRKVYDRSKTAETRILKSLTVLKLCYQIIGEKINLPLSNSDLEMKAFTKALEMQEHLHSTDGLSEFWKVIEYLLDRNEIELGWELKIEAKISVSIRKKIDGNVVDEPRKFETETKLIYLRLAPLVQAYNLHMSRMGKSKEVLSESTLEAYMSSQPYWIGLCPGTTFKSQVHNSTKNTSCKVLRYDLIGINLESSDYTEEREKITITGEVFKYPEKATQGKFKFSIKDYVVSKSGDADKTDERLTTCYCDEAQCIIVNESKEITVVGMLSIKHFKYRNLDVIELWKGSAVDKIEEVQKIDEDTPF